MSTIILPPSSGGATLIPYQIDSTATYTIPIEDQAVSVTKMTVNGMIVINGILVEKLI